MKKARFSALAIMFVLSGLVAAGVRIAGNDTALPDKGTAIDPERIYLAPFDRASASMSASSSTCRSNPPLAIPTVGRPDVQTGRIDMAESANGVSCTSGARLAATWNFELGQGPPLLVGGPAVIHIVINRDPSTFGTIERGTAARSASARLGMKGAPDVTLISIDCDSTTCSRYEAPAEEDLIYADFALLSMPETLELTMTATAQFGRGTGGAAAWFAGTIEMVTVTQV